MTLVAAFRSMGRIVVMSDTMISDERSHRQRNRIPGQLKTIVLNKWLTVAYSGLSIQALDAIRQLRRVFPLTTQSAVRYLQETSVYFKGEIDFLVCSHQVAIEPRLIKICGPLVSEGQDLYWIGNPTSASALARMELLPIPGESAGEYYSLEETRFTRRFHEYVQQGADSAVGGMVINSLASPYGHCYQDHLGVYADEITIPDPVEPSLRQRMNGGGMNGYYKYAVLTAPERGVALLGTYFEQAGVGFIHEPLERDDPEKVEAEDQNEFQALIAERSRAADAKQNVG